MFTFILPALVLFSNNTPKYVLPMWSMEALTEENTNSGHLSSGKDGLPIIEMTIMARVVLGGQGIGGETVHFVVSESDSDKIHLSESQSTTDSTGRCYITVKAKNFNYSDNTNVIVTAHWEPSPEVAPNGPVPPVEKLITMIFRRFTPSDEISASFSLPGLEFPEINPSISIPYLDQAPSWLPMGTTGNSRNAWTLNLNGVQRTSFTSGADAKIKWSNDSLPPESPEPARVNYDSETDIRTIIFSEYNMNGTVSNGSIFIPVDKRHHVQSTATHELGHAISLGHDSPFYGLFVPKSVMVGGPVRYFVMGIIDPQIRDKEVIKLYYPN